MTATGPNYYEDKARREKARKLAQFMYDEMLRIIEAADDNMWNGTAARAGVNPPGPETRRMVYETLRDRRP